VLRRSVEFAQYASYAFQGKPAELGVRCSMSRKGYCRDNAPTKSFFSSLNNERAHGQRYRTPLGRRKTERTSGNIKIGHCASVPVMGAYAGGAAH
jgi:transposase InsO family protein